MSIANATCVALAAAMFLSIAQLPMPAQQAGIRVWPDVQISSVDKFSYNEVRIAADPRQPNNLIACGSRMGGPIMDAGSLAFFSKDGGATWHPSVAVVSAAGDPECEFGNHGEAFFVASIYADRPLDARTLVYRSNDRGANWSAHVTVPFIDREQMAMDRTSSKWANTLYILGKARVIVTDATGDTRTLPSSTVYRSNDGGKFFNATIVAHSETDLAPLYHTHPVVLSDGTVVFIIQQRNSKGILVYASNDGAVSFSNVSRTSESRLGPGLGPELAVGRDGVFRDRLYAVFCSQVESAAQTPLLISSNDRGKTWTSPTVVGPPTGPCIWPEVSANRYGVVGVSWYSGKHGHAYPSATGNSNFLSYDARKDLDVRFAASLDGGQSFLPSVLVNPISHQAPLRLVPYAMVKQATSVDDRMWLAIRSAKDLGETAGLATDAAGFFHPDWIDFRSGVGEIMTTKIKVAGRIQNKPVGNVRKSQPPLPPPVSPQISVEKLAATVPHVTLTRNGQPSPSTLTSDFRLDLMKMRFTEKTSDVSLQLRLAPITAKAKGAVFLEVVDDTGEIAYLNSDNQERGVGAHWMFTPAELRCVKIHVNAQDFGPTTQALIHFRVIPSDRPTVRPTRPSRNESC